MNNKVCNRFPRFLYKFMPINKYTISNLLNNQLWFASPISYNDPFDCSFFIKSGYDSNYAEKIESNFVNLGIYQDGEIKSYIPNFKKIFKENPDGFGEFLNEEMHKLLSTLGISCFCDNKKNTLLWAHYADSHKGICLKFDTKKDMILFNPEHNNSDCIAISRVNYKSNYSKIPTYREIADKILYVVPFTKSKEWSYENEIRMLSKKTGALKFNKSTLIEISFGCNCSEMDLNDIYMLVQNTNYPNVVFKKAIKSKTNFCFDFIDVK